MRISKHYLESASDVDAAVWRAAVIAGGGTVSGTQLGYVDSLTYQLKIAGVWSVLDLLWLPASENTTQALTDLKARIVATPVNNPTFTANRGYAGDGSTSYLNMGAAMNALANFRQDAASQFVWVETDTALTGDRRYIGYDENNYGFIGQPTGAPTQISYSVNGSAGPNLAMTRTQFLLANRTASNAQAIYRNGAQTGSATTTSVTVTDKNLFGLAGNVSGGPYGRTDARIAMLGVGGVMTGPQILAFYNAMRTYMTAVGVA